MRLHLLRAVRRHLSTSTSRSRKVKNLLQHVPYYHRQPCLTLAQQSISDYLHTTRSLHPPIPDLIASNSPLTLTSLLSSIPFSSPSLFPSALRRHLRYRPINELHFFLESIGIPFPTPTPLSSSPFLSDHPHLLRVATALLDFGFPWTRLGHLYLHTPLFSSADPSLLPQTISSLSLLPLSRPCAVAVCLTFPRVFSDPDYADLIFHDARLLLADFDPPGTVEDNVDLCLRVCRRIAFMYEMGCPVGSVGEGIGGWWKVFRRSREDVLEMAMGFLRGLGMERDEAWRFVTEHPEVMEIDASNCEVSMPEFLEHAGFTGRRLEVACGQHPYVVGKNKLANLPGCLRVLGYDRWLLEKVRSGDLRYLSREFLEEAKGNGDAMDAKFREGLESVRRVGSLLVPKVEFLQEIGFGRNGVLVRALRLVNGTREDLKDRFDFLIGLGFEYSDLCRLISLNPKVLNHGNDLLRMKIDFLRNELGLSLRYLNNFSTYLCFDLEKRIKPRYRILDWLRSKGLEVTWSTPSTVISTTEKKFVACLSGSHRAAPKFWFEVFKFNNHGEFYPDSSFTNLNFWNKLLE